MLFVSETMRAMENPDNDSIDSSAFSSLPLYERNDACRKDSFTRLTSTKKVTKPSSVYLIHVDMIQLCALSFTAFICPDVLLLFALTSCSSCCSLSIVMNFNGHQQICRFVGFCWDFGRMSTKFAYLVSST